MRCIPERSILVFYADATGTDTVALTSLTDPGSDNRGGFAAAGHLCGNQHFIDPGQNVRQD